MDSSSEGDNNQPNGHPPLPSPSGQTATNRPFPGVGTTGFMGKHRMTAAISYLEQQIQIIQEELDQLETLGQSSTVCKELVTSVESAPDPLLPVTKGPLEVSWDRWFQGGHGSRNRRRWI
ncbi:hypothetical protein M9H77_25491 [Catharanthus roseus]|uniref:Uncharacterized protein n=1 Tax=Catharanthus roseus TaxID=4058 RepID=A0ACC0A718_CATRO|nr:hypothetical protein M9H77_25491 [Catharanthus roseus]